MAPDDSSSPEPSTSTAASGLPGELTEAASRTRDHIPGPGVSGDTASPTSFGQYQVLEWLGGGGMGDVYLARDPLLNRQVAVKQLKYGDALSQMQRERFDTEARAVAALDHPNVVPIFGYDRSAARPYIVMKYLPGGSLAARRAALAGDPRAVVALMVKVARAVQHAHDRRVLHRDLKPANILLDEHGEPLVGDFGLAKILDDSDQTYTGQVLGTPAYMAPEQRTGRTRDIGFPCDVWALGITIRELVTGQRAADSEAEPTPRTPATPAPAASRFQLDRGLRAIVNRCLQPRPADRYPSAAALADDLEKWLRGEYKPPMSRGRRRFLLAGAGTMLALAGGITAAWLIRRPRTALDRLRWEIEHDGKAELLTPTGEPRWQQALMPNVDVIYGRADNEAVITVGCVNTGLLEFVSGLTVDGASLSGEVRLVELPLPKAGGRFGLYAGRSLEGTPPAGQHCFVCLNVHDVADPNRAVARLDLLSATADRLHWRPIANDTRPVQPSAWHTFTLELAGDHVAAATGDDVFASGSRSRLQEVLSGLNRGGGTLKSTLTADGGWGLVVCQCRVDLRRLHVTRIRS